MYFQLRVVEGHSLTDPCWRWPIPTPRPPFHAGLCLGGRGQEGFRPRGVGEFLPVGRMNEPPSFPEWEEWVYKPFPHLVRRRQLREDLVRGSPPSCHKDLSRSGLVSIPEDCVVGTLTLGESEPPASSIAALPVSLSASWGSSSEASNSEPALPFTLFLQPTNRQYTKSTGQ